MPEKGSFDQGLLKITSIAIIPDASSHLEAVSPEVAEHDTEPLDDEGVVFDAGDPTNNLTLPGSTVNTQPLNYSSSLSAPALDSEASEATVSPYALYMKKLQEKNISLIYPYEYQQPSPPTVPEIPAEIIIAEVGRSEMNEYMSSSDAWETLISEYGCTEGMADGLINTLQESFSKVFVSQVHINHANYYLAIGREIRTKRSFIDGKEKVSFYGVYGVSLSSEMGNVLFENPASN